ncbi:hypothetical protein OsJ_34813 [Oryza sativa Japonica Group]|uniref:VWFA domain-containing protein n=1 Tax=Oryza sativa subsp. japonica TaxID=39947 RepID=B9G8U3_ORYSJ|nr:hypothetical protein OsJ_34813 [Oryza sativa Japonica Group]
MASSSAGKTKMEATSKAAIDRQEVRVSTTPIRAAIARDQRKDDFEVLVTVEAPKVVAPEKRAPIDLVAVLDVSGSMNKEEFVRGKHMSSRLDLLKIAMKYIIKLVRDADRLAIVSFNHAVVSEYGLTRNSADSRKKLENLVDKLKASGNTDFRPALKKAVEILDGRGKEEKKKRVGFILLLSDGVDQFQYSRINWEKVAKSTDVDHSEVGAMLRKYAVHTFGFSASHDPVPLRQISALSYGLYSFVCKNLDNITEAFARCLGGLRTVVAAEIRVDLKPKSSDKQQQQQPVLIKSIDSGGYESQVIGGGTSGKILIPVLYVDEVKKFIVHLKVPKVSATTVNNQQEILTADGDANSVDGKTVRIKEHKLAIRRPPEVVDQADLRPAPQVVEQVVVFKLLDMVPKTFQQRREDDHKGVKNTKVAVQLLQRNMDEIRRSDAWTDLDVGTRRRIDEQVKEIADHVEKGEGPAYVNSWVSSQEMQRANTMGSPNKVVAGRVRDAGDEDNSGGGEKATGGEDR